MYLFHQKLDKICQIPEKREFNAKNAIKYWMQIALKIIIWKSIKKLIVKVWFFDEINHFWSKIYHDRLLFAFNYSYNWRSDTFADRVISAQRSYTFHEMIGYFTYDLYLGKKYSELCVSGDDDSFHSSGRDLRTLRYYW